MPCPAESDPPEPDVPADPVPVLEQIEGDVLEHLASSGEALARRLFGPRRGKAN